VLNPSVLWSRLLAQASRHDFDPLDLPPAKRNTRPLLEVKRTWHRKKTCSAVHPEADVTGFLGGRSNPVTPREWFLMPLFVIDDAVEKIRDGTNVDYVYDPQAAKLKRVD
jgi:hypothetical protein